MRKDEVANPADTGEQKRALLEAAIASSPFTTWIGTRLTAFEESRVDLDFDVRPDLTRHHGFAPGAVVGDVVTAGYTLDSLSPTVGETLRCRADVFVVRSAQQKLVATASATIARVSV